MANPTEMWTEVQFKKAANDALQRLNYGAGCRKMGITKCLKFTSQEQLISLDNIYGWVFERLCSSGHALIFFCHISWTVLIQTWSTQHEQSMFHFFVGKKTVTEAEEDVNPQITVQVHFVFSIKLMRCFSSCMPIHFGAF